jgi:hypothetical protein
LSEIQIFNRALNMSLFGQELELNLCSNFLGMIGDQPAVGIGASVTGGGDSDEDALGAVILRDSMPTQLGNELQLDIRLISQLLFSSWNAGGLNQVIRGATRYGTLSVLHPDVPPLFPSDTPVDVKVTAELSPVLSIPDREVNSVADLQINLPDIRLDLLVEGSRIASLMANISIALELIPNDEAELIPVPTMGGIKAEVHLIDEPMVDFSLDSVLETVVTNQLKDVVSGLLSTARPRLPTLGGVIKPIDINPSTESGYVVVSLWDPFKPDRAFDPLLSVNTQSRLGESSLRFDKGDIVKYSASLDEARVSLPKDIFRRPNGSSRSNIGVNAVHYVKDTGHYLLSTSAKTYLGQEVVEIRSGDVVEYDPLNDEAYIVLSQDVFRKSNGRDGASANIDAIYRDDQGIFYLSTTNSNRLGAPPNMLRFSAGDIIRYDSDQDEATLVIAAAEIFRKSNGDPQGTGNIDALHILDDQRVMFSTGAAGTVGTNKLKVKDGDLIIYDQQSGHAGVYVSESMFRKPNGNIDANSDINATSLIETP